MTTILTGSAAPPALARTRRVFVPLALLAALMAFVGFWPTYFGPLLAGAGRHSVLIHAHAAVFMTWLAVFAMQAVLAATGRIALHRRLGRWLFVFGVLLIAAVARMEFLGTPQPDSIFLIVWQLPIYIAMVHDYATKRLVHPVYVVGLLVMLAMVLVFPVRESQPWLSFTAWLATFYE